MVEKIKNIVKKINSELITHQEEWIKNDIISSFEVINLISELESQFNITIEPEDFVPEHFNSLTDVINLVRKYSADD